MRLNTKIHQIYLLNKYYRFTSFVYFTELRDIINNATVYLEQLKK